MTYKMMDIQQVSIKDIYPGDYPRPETVTKVQDAQVGSIVPGVLLNTLGVLIARGNLYPFVVKDGNHRFALLTRQLPPDTLVNFIPDHACPDKMDEWVDLNILCGIENFDDYRSIAGM